MMGPGFAMQIAGSVEDPRNSLVSSASDLTVTVGTDIEGVEGIAYRHFGSQVIEPMMDTTASAVQNFATSLQGSAQDASNAFWNSQVGTAITHMRTSYNDLLNALDR
jgi:hypothetical protein